LVRTSLIIPALSLLAIAGPAGAADQDMPTEKAAPSAVLAARALGVDPNTPSPTATPVQIDLGRAIGREVVCLCGTCPKRTITDCDCGWAKANQVAILNAVVQGKTREQIIQVFRQSYGDQSLAQLPSDNTLAKAAWAVPYLGAGLGLMLVLLAGMRLARNRQAAPVQKVAARAAIPDDAAKKQLERELDELD
jgi:cytochrome c-type biogenesis protein CcmH/NrfF